MIDSRELMTIVTWFLELIKKLPSASENVLQVVFTERIGKVNAVERGTPFAFEL
jgi:hypothetical protein